MHATGVHFLELIFAPETDNLAPWQRHVQMGSRKKLSVDPSPRVSAAASPPVQVRSIRDKGPAAPSSAAIAEMAEASQRNERSERVPPLARPRLLVNRTSPDVTVANLRAIMVRDPALFDRGLPVRLTVDQMGRQIIVQPLTPQLLVLLAHQLCRPYVRKVQKDGAITNTEVRLPTSDAMMYLEWRGEWELRPLHGITRTPLLSDDGSIRCAEGYDTATGMWCADMPDIASFVPLRPTRSEAGAALRFIRRSFESFCFADATVIAAGKDGPAVDVSRPAGRDESAFLATLQTAICRPSLPLAPGVAIRAPAVSGAGAGKGLLARCVGIVAYGTEPDAVTAGGNTEEMEKRIAAELIEAKSMLLLDNLNNTGLRSDLLASVITESPARVRILGTSRMVSLQCSTMIMVTGNGLTISEDLVRRFIVIELDPRTEDPEARRFDFDIRAKVQADRRQLLAASLTIWRWGRQTRLPQGRALGSFEKWSAWIRDPLVALGCEDPVEAITNSKGDDAHRQSIVELYRIWHDTHGLAPISASALDRAITQLLDPQGRGRQFVAAKLQTLVGTRIAGLMLTRQAPNGRWGVATYALMRADSSGA